MSQLGHVMSEVFISDGVPPLKLDQVTSRPATSVTHVTCRVLS